MSTLVEEPVEVSLPKSTLRIVIEACVLVAMVVASLVLIVRSTAPDDPMNTARVVQVLPAADPAPSAMP
ncbi:MAG: hypothetical protein U0800_15460 [Isosphaeraceae bacterium]